MICVYDAACTDFSNNGLGPINPSSCQVTETLNGEYELTVIHPIDDVGKWQRLVEGNIVRAPVPAAMTPQIKPNCFGAGSVSGKRLTERTSTSM